MTKPSRQFGGFPEGVEQMALNHDTRSDGCPIVELDDDTVDDVRDLVLEAVNSGVDEDDVPDFVLTRIQSRRLDQLCDTERALIGEAIDGYLGVSA